MSDLSERLKNLSPEQQRLLMKRLKDREGQGGAAKPEQLTATEKAKRASGKQAKLDFSLAFFSADGKGMTGNKYHLLLESAKFADKHGFKAVWTPERHFQAFGGLYPNPSLLAAAIATVTEHVHVRAGSVVIPLHHPVRLTEEWSVVDNLSNGRAGISLATGWHNYDYVIKPENFHNRREIMFQNIKLVQKLWRGEAVTFPGVDGAETTVSTVPRPIQPQLPIWVTASSQRTWRQAGELGAGVLGMIPNNLDDLVHNIKEYRQGLMQNGHDPRSGTVTLMVHTFVGPDLEAVRELTRNPMKEYLKNYLKQFRQLMTTESPEAELASSESVLDFAFQRYFNNSSLLGTVDKCADMVETLAAIGVDEIACLVDFGVDPDQVLNSLDGLAQLVKTYGKNA